MNAKKIVSLFLILIGLFIYMNYLSFADSHIEIDTSYGLGIWIITLIFFISGIATFFTDEEKNKP